MYVKHYRFLFWQWQTNIIIANTVKHTHSLVVSITEIIEYYKNGYMSATVGTRLHLVSG